MLKSLAKILNYTYTSSMRKKGTIKEYRGSLKDKQELFSSIARNAANRALQNQSTVCYIKNGKIVEKSSSGIKIIKDAPKKIKTPFKKLDLSAWSIE